MDFKDVFNKMAMFKNRTSYDAAAKFADAQTLTADGVLQVGGGDNILDLGSNAAMWRNQVLNFALAEIDDANADETYAFVIEESEDNTFTTVRKSTIVSIPRDAGSTTDDPILYSTEMTPEYQFLRISVDVGGTTPSLKLLQAFYSPNVGM